VLTRLEVHGFKNLLHFSVDFGPFNCIAGPNGVGKSNIFDAIRFLSLLADHSLMQAAFSIREADLEVAQRQDFFWEPEDIFWTDGKTRIDSIRLAAEMIVNEEVFDDFGRPAKATSTFLEYELEIGYEEPKAGEKLGRLILLSEQLGYIAKGEAHSRLHFAHSAQEFRNQIIKNKRRGSPFISTEQAPDGKTEILVHQDGGSRGQPQKAPAASAPKTIVGTTNTSVTPTILAAKREMQSWRFLALEPSSMRGADRFFTDPHVTPNGGHLPATLHRLATRNGMQTNGVASTYAQIASRLSEFLPVRDVRVRTDEVRQLLTLEVKEKSGVFLPARSLSDGTLRFLTLCVLERDPDFSGLLCMEEPENGIHPARLSAMVDLLRDLAVDPTVAPGSENPLRQVIVATHSPYFVQLQNPEDLLYAKPTKVIGPSASSTTTLRCLPLRGSRRAEKQEAGIGKGDILSYLSTPPEAQIGLPHTTFVA